MQTLIRWWLATWICLGALPGVLAAQTAEPSASAARITKLVDGRVKASWAAQGFQPSWCDDATFLRRASLDLTGLVPTPGEIRQFLADPAPDKRTRLVERLTASNLAARHLANRWTQVLTEARPDVDGSALTDWLEERFARNLRYDRVVADLLASSGTNEPGPAAYFQACEYKPEKLASSSARIFLGTRLGCAECHDHPFDKWSQEDFWGYAAFFAQVAPRNMMDRGAAQLADRAEGDVKIPNTELVVLPRYPDGVDADRHGIGTRRQWLALWMASRENSFLGRAAVNRVWSQLFGRGLVHPVDDLGPKNPGVDPELLDQLSQAFVDSGYDLRALYRGLANSVLYRLASRSEAPAGVATGSVATGSDSAGSDSGAEPAATAVVADFDFFHAYPIRPLTAEQLYDSLARNLMTAPAFNEVPGGPLQAASQRARFINQMRSVAGDDGTYRAGVQQALSQMNGELTASLLDRRGSRLLQSLSAPFLTTPQQIDLIYLATVSRYPTADERQRVVELLQLSADSRLTDAAAADLTWAMVNSSEFLFCR
ncbi:MAG: DUF1549 domain-containing protein [Pirellulales bacterium]